MQTRKYIFSWKNINFYISDLSCIQNIIYLTANFVLVPIKINLKKNKYTQQNYK